MLKLGGCKTFSRKVFNSHAGGMTIARPYGFEVDFMRNPISESASWFFVIILKFIFTPIFQIKINPLKFLDTKKFHFRIPITINISIYLNKVNHGSTWAESA